MPAFRSVVCIPALDLASDKRVLAIATTLRFTVDPVEVAVIRVMMHTSRTCPNGDLSLLPHGAIQLWAGPNFYKVPFEEAFREQFVVEGQFVLYQELNGSRVRHREQCKLRMRDKRTGKAPPKQVPKKRTATEKSDAFEAAWTQYPKRSGGNPKALAEKAWRARVKEGVSEQELTDATVRYAAKCRAEGREDTVYVMQGGTFYGPNERWKDFLNINPRETSDLDDVLAEVARAYDCNY